MTALRVGSTGPMGHVLTSGLRCASARMMGVAEDQAATQETS